MIPGFEDYTYDLTKREKELIPLVISSLSNKTEDNRITGKEIKAKAKIWIDQKNAIIKEKGEITLNDKVYTRKFLALDEHRIMKLIQYIRGNGILPIIASQKGYYVSYDRKDILMQIRSLRSRAVGCLIGARGLLRLLWGNKTLTIDDVWNLDDNESEAA